MRLRDYITTNLARPATARLLDITMRLTENAAFDLDARTGSGVVETSHPLTVTGAVSRSRLQGTVRGGGPKLNVATASGSIRIR